jgi:hypothetical protein
MPGLVPGIHALLMGEDVDGRVKPGHTMKDIHDLSRARK